MKYAFIALIALYLIVYGCSPDTTEKAKESHETAVETSVEKSHDGEKAAVAVEHQKPAATEHHEAKDVAHKTDQPAQQNIEAPAVIMQQPVVIEQKPAQPAEPEQVVLPCGKTMSQADLAENPPPCLKMHTPTLQLQDAAATGTEQELQAALQKMVKTTNEMVLATRQLVIATQEILNASKKTAEQTPPVAPSAEGHGAAPAQP